MRVFTRWLLLPALLLGGLLTGTAALGRLVVPQVQDRGHFFSPAAIEKADKLILEIERDFKKDLMIETYPTPPSDKAQQFEDATREKRAELFQGWARERAKELKVNGVYVLICKQPGHIEVEVGNETQRKAFTRENRNELASGLLKKFREASEAKDAAAKQKLYDQALIEGCEFVGRTMKTNGAGKVGQVVPASPSHPGRPANTGLLGGGIAGLICLAFVVLLVVWVLVALIRAFTGAGRGGYADHRPGYGGGTPGYGGAPGYGGGGGGGFMSGLLGGLFGAAAGNFLYDRFFRGDSGGGGWGASSAYGGSPSAPSGGSQPQDTDYSGTGGDFGDSGGDQGGGGDFGGDCGGGDFGGGGDF